MSRMGHIFSRLTFFGILVIVSVAIRGVADDFSPENFKVAKSHNLSLAIKPGLLEEGGTMSFDDDGRIFVTGPKSGTIKLLADTDEDGIFDEASLFAEGIDSPFGSLWVYDSLYVLSPKGMWYLEDLDADGKADSKALLISGFSGKGQLSGPFLHLNGRVYWGSGNQAFQVVDPETGDVVSTGEKATIWSCDINGGDIRVFAKGDFPALGEMAFTETGEILGTVGGGLYHWLHGGFYDGNEGSLGALHQFDGAEISGFCRWNDKWLVAKPNEILEISLKSTNSSFSFGESASVLEGKEFADVIEDRNGDLLVLAKNGEIYRLAPAGRKEFKPADFPMTINWKEMDPIEVAKLLNDKREFVQQRAITEMAVRGDSSIAEIRQAIEEGKPSVQYKRNAIWALSRMKFSDSPDFIADFLKDPDPSVQLAACNAVSVTRTWQQIAANQSGEMIHELNRNRTISGALSTLIRRGTPQVARNATVAVGVMAESRAIGSLIGRAGRGEADSAMEHAIIQSLVEMGDHEAVLNVLRIGNSEQKRYALVALEKMPGYKVQPLDIILLLDSKDEELRKTVAKVARFHPEWDAAIANQFYWFTDDLTPERLSQIVQIAPDFADTQPMKDFAEYCAIHKDEKVAELWKQLQPFFPQGEGEISSIGG